MVCLHWVPLLDLSHWIYKLWNVMAVVYLSIDHIVRFLLLLPFAVKTNKCQKYLNWYLDIYLYLGHTWSIANETSTGNKIHPKNAPKSARPKPATAAKLTFDTPFHDENIFYTFDLFFYFQNITFILLFIIKIKVMKKKSLEILMG